MTARTQDVGPIGEYLFTGADWDYATVKRAYDAIETIAEGELALDVYTNQIEVISAEQMLDAYSSLGMPVFYKHWSFGKHFARDEALYRKGMQGLAYEIVINSNPCISYIMEENTMLMQTLVMAHAAFGHNHFFKNNYVFQAWTDANGILDYLEFAKNYIARCEEMYGTREVERVLDAAHALMSHGVHRYPRRQPLNLREEAERERERERYQEQTYNDLWRTVPDSEDEERMPAGIEERRRLLGLPEENLLYFLEKKAPKLQQWQREILRIVRNVAQYFYPQKQTKVMNEGCATATHYYIMNRLYEKGFITDGAMLEFLHMHSNVVFQPEFDDPRFSGMNPYALGFGMMQDIQRICTEPTDEDRYWFPDIAGNGDFVGTWKEAWANYRDESFVLQFLSPHLIRQMRLFRFRNDSEEPYVEVDAIHDEAGYQAVRKSVAQQYDIARIDPDLQITDVDLAGDRKLILEHRVLDGVLLEEKNTLAVLRHLANLWGYEVKLLEVDPATEQVLNEYPDTAPSQPVA